MGDVAAARLHGFLAALTSFVGRGEEIAAVTAQLGRARLVTLAGPGGVGKTRLAAEVARQVASRYADGVWLAELGDIKEPALASAAVARALDLQLPPGTAQEESLAALLARRQLLLVLDNCEHLRPAIAALCGTVLRAADDVQVLTTSREPLGLAGECRYRLGPLPLSSSSGDAESDAMTLFADRARLADPGFALDSSSRPVLDRLLARLDGMPLAIELAAARGEALGLTQLAGLPDDGFGVLAGTDPLAADRHRTLAATAEWSYRLLAEPERRVFRMLAALPGPFTLEAAQAVAGPDAQQPVLRLVDCSLLVPPRPGPDGRPRYLMLQTLRSYAAQQLARQPEECAAADMGLARYARNVAEQAAQGLASSVAELDAARRLDAEDGTVHQALTWALEHDAATALRLAVALTPWWSLRGRYLAGRALLSAACQAVPEDSLQWCTAQVCQGRLATGNDETAALVHFTAARDALAADVAAGGRPVPVLAEALAGRANCLLNLGRTAEAAEQAGSALDVARTLRYPPGEVRALLWLGASAYYAGDLPDCLPRWLEIQRIDPTRIPGSLVRRSTLFLVLALAESGQFAEAHTHCVRVLSLARQAGALFDEADALIHLAHVSLLMDHLADTRAALRGAMKLNGRIGNDLLVFDCLDLSGQLCARTRRHAEALTVWAADATLRHEAGIPLPPQDAQRRDEPLRGARQALGAQQAGEAEARGAAMTLPLAADYAALLLAGDIDGTAGPPAPQPLSGRERELVTLVAQGRTNAQIAEQLYISVRTVGSHLDRIRDKTGCRRRADLTRLALQAGLV